MFINILINNNVFVLIFFNPTFKIYTILMNKLTYNCELVHKRYYFSLGSINFVTLILKITSRAHSLWT